ncbi:MAG: sugar ABC transporter permease [Firmicutes bacterium]|nr:sugar ABC transporter permease [Bacillota bacterium]
MGTKFPGKLYPLLLLLPTFVVIALFIYYPMYQTINMSLYKSLFMGLRQIYVGIENYIELFSSTAYRQSLVRSFTFAGCVVALSMTISFLMAILANQKVRFGRLYRTALIWPYALSPAVAGSIFLFIFNPSVGVLNYLLQTTFGIRPDWISNSTLAFTMVVIAAVWKQLGYNIVFFLAALQNVPGDIVEAADIDGANAIQRYWKVIIPLLSPTSFFLLTMNLIYAFFDTFGLVDVMTRGGPVDATNTLIYNLYRDAFQYSRTGFAAAQSIMLFGIVTIVMIVQLRLGNRTVYYQND